MKIAFLSSRFPPDFIGGGEWSTATIASGISELGNDIHVFCGAKEDKEEEFGLVRVHRRKELHGLWDKPLFEQRKSRHIAYKMRKYLQDFDIIHAHDFRSALALAELKLPNSFVTVRDFAPICGTTNNMWWNGASCTGCSWSNVTRRCHRVVEAPAVRKPFRVWQYKYNLGYRNRCYQRLSNQVYISEALRKRVASRLELSVNSRVIHNPVSNEWFKPLVGEKPIPRITYIGTVESYKGISLLIQAFARCSKTVPKASLQIIGSGRDLDRYKKLAKDLGTSKILFSGRLGQQDVIKQIDQSLAVVQPSLWEEPFGRTIIEAYARGKAVIASETGGLKETFKEGTGFLVKPSVEEIGDALKIIFTHPDDAMRMGVIGRKYAEENFTARKIGQQYLNFYSAS